MSRPGDETLGAVGWLNLVMAAFVCFATWLALVWLLWSCVPAHSALFAGLGMPLPLSTRMAIAAAHSFIRYLPFGVVGAVMGGPVVVGGCMVAFVLLVSKVGWPRVARAFTTIGLALSLVDFVSCGFIVTSIHAAYKAAASDPVVQENLRAFQQFRTAAGGEQRTR